VRNDCENNDICDMLADELGQMHEAKVKVIRRSDSVCSDMGW
jgi:hypothetical protein